MIATLLTILAIWLAVGIPIALFLAYLIRKGRS